MNLVSEATGEVGPQLERVLGDHTGLIREIEVLSPGRTGPQLFVSQPRESALSSLFKSGDSLSLDAAGKALTRDGSLEGTIGEFLERYSLYWPRSSEITTGSYEQLLEKGLDVAPFEYVDVLPERAVSTFGRAAFRRDTVLEWCRGTNLLDGSAVYVPAQLIYMGVDRGDEYPHCFEATSNGCAAARTRSEALQASIRELVERDAFVRTWYSGESPPVIDLNPLPDLRRVKEERFDSKYRSFQFIELDTDLPVTAVGCIAHDRRDKTPKFVIGTAAGFDRTDAMFDALVEAGQGWPYVQYLTASSTEAVDPDTVSNFEDNVRYYANKENFAEVEHLLRGDVISPTPDDRATATLSEWLSVLEDASCSPIGFDLTTRDVHSIGVTVTRVWIPELLSLPLPSLPHTAHPRFPDGHEHLHPLP